MGVSHKQGGDWKQKASEHTNDAWGEERSGDEDTETEEEVVPPTGVWWNTQCQQLEQCGKGKGEYHEEDTDADDENKITYKILMLWWRPIWTPPVAGADADDENINIREHAEK